MGWRGIALIVCGISVGFVLGTALGDAYSGTATGLLRGHDAVPSLLITVAASVAISFFFYSRGGRPICRRTWPRPSAMPPRHGSSCWSAARTPHDVQHLANLRVLIAADPPRAQAMLDHLIAYLRATLGGARTTVHPLADEFARLADYLEIMAVRMGPRLTFSLDLPEALQEPLYLLAAAAAGGKRHPPRTGATGRWRPHPGARQHPARPAGALLALEVVDTGVGLAQPPAACRRPASHFGLAQVRERLATLYGTQGTLELIAVTAGGTSARVTFPLNFPAT